MRNQRLAEKMLKCLEKEKYGTYERILKKNADNEELWDILIGDSSFTDQYLFVTAEFMDKLSISIQKKLIEVSTFLLKFSSDELRNDRFYMQELQRKISSKEANNEELDGGSISSVYSYLGSKLSCDKEFLLSIKEEAPQAFIDSMSRVQYDEETIRKFFDENPCFVEKLPDSLKYDFEYVASLISQLSSEDIRLYCCCMTYDYLQNDLVREAIVKVAGEEGYKKVLVSSLEEYPEQLGSISTEELKELILLEPDGFLNIINTTDMFKSFLSTEQHRANIKVIQTMTNASKLLFSQVNTPQKLSSVLEELSKNIGKGLTYDEIFNQVSANWQQILPWIMQIDDWHQTIYDKVEGFSDYRSFYNIYNLLIGIECNKLEEMFKIFINSELRASPYGKGIQSIHVTDENLPFLQFSCTESFFCSDARTMEMYNKLFLKINDWLHDPYQALGFIQLLSNDFRLRKLLLDVDIDTLDLELLKNLFGYVFFSIGEINRITSLEDLRDYQKLVEMGVSTIKVKNLETFKNKLVLKYFQIDLERIEIFIHSYFGANKESSLYQEMPEVKYLKDILERITSAGSMEQLEELDRALSNQNVKATFKDIYEIIGNIKKSYGKEINTSLLQVGNNSGIIDATNIDFKLLVHVIGAYGAAPSGDVYDSWNTKENTSNTGICTSFISDSNMGISPTTEHSVILGFNNLPDDFLEIMSCHDLYSYGFSAFRESRFLKPEELINNTRHGHNELVIRRRKGQYTEEKIEPSYIICFDSVNEESRIASQKFGVPILFINREKVVERHYHEIMEYKEQFKESLNPHLISKIITGQENNKAGLRLVRPDLVEKYFSTEMRQQTIEELYTAISQGLARNDSNAKDAMNEFVRVIELEASKFAITKETPHRKNVFDVHYQEFLETFKANSAYTSDFTLSFELTPEELYERFIECRNRLAEKEVTELQYINSNMNSIGQDVSNYTRVGG